MSIVKFSNPPLSEVVFGVVFNAPEFSSVHFGLYWQEIRERFPIPPTDKPSLGGEGVNFSFLPPLRRMWFESSNKQELVQLQSDRFYYNWRRQDDTERYPKFVQIYPRFIEEWNKFHEWWVKSTGLIIPIQYELTYINQIDKEFGWGAPADHQKILTFAGRDWSGFLKAPESYIFALQFLLPENSGSLSVNGNQAISALTGEQVMVLELTARSSDASSSLGNWFELAHEYIVKSFMDLTQNSIHEKWGLYEQ